MSRVICIANQKGGVGKTTVTMNLGVALAKAGKEVLLMDSDPQANLTSYLRVTPGKAPYQNLKTLDEMYLAKKSFENESTHQVHEDFVAKTQQGVDLIAADTALSGVEYYLFSRNEKEYLLKKFLNSIAYTYDFILIDTPPSLNLLTINALCASDSVLVPVQTQFFSMEGIVKIRKTIEAIREQWNPELKLLGVVANQVSERRRLTRDVLDILQQELGSKLFTSVIRDNTAVTESSGHGKSVLNYRRQSTGSKDFLATAEELIQRMNNEALQ